MNEKSVTDWDVYYKKKRSFFSEYTQRFTLELILDLYNKTCEKANKGNVLELGGGNSCFAENFCKKTCIDRYDIIDNNEYAVALFRDKSINAEEHKGIVLDLKNPDNAIPEMKYDFVFSIGLIEHFNDDDRRNVIDNHFKFCKEEGYVLISFPTPTLKYRFWRKVMELLGMWQFWDERPMFYEDIKSEFEKNGEVKEVVINKKLFLTQTIVLVKAK